MTLSRPTPAALHAPPLFLSLLLGPLFLTGCERGAEEEPSVSPAAERYLFAEVARPLGLVWELERPVPGDFFMPDIMGGGCALFDYDADGDLDAYVVAGFHDADGGFVNAGGENRLFRQEADGRFVDVTLESGAGDRSYGMGVAVGDVDNDGFPDLFLANYGPDRLLHNEGDGTFTDITEKAGVAGEGWSTSCGFFDYDRDGLLDLFVVRYVDYRQGTVDRDAAGKPEYPAPAGFPGMSDLLFHNRGGLAFADVSSEAGIADSPGRGLGLTFSDLDGDGREDVCVANDGEPNFAWLQRDAGVFEEGGALLGVAVNGFGTPEASMGVACGDYDEDGDDDLFLTHLDGQSNTLYQRVRDGYFRDGTVASGLGPPSHGHTGFGTAFLDLDLDGDLDLVSVNGSVLHHPPLPGCELDAHWATYAQANQVFENVGAGRFEWVREGGGAFCSEIEVSRGLATGDIDGDGDLDFLVSNANGTVRLYRNEAQPRGAWLTVRAIDPELSRDAFGAVVEVTTATARLRRRVHAAGSYLSSSDPRAHFGLGPAERVASIRVDWPDGSSEVFDGGPVKRALTLLKGEGR